MATPLQKVQIGKNIKSKKPHNISHDASTTTSFGLVQPFSCTEVAPGDVIKFKTKFGVRAMPMVVPTFGRLLVKQYFKYVPLTDIHRDFQELLTNNAVSTDSSSSDYVPDFVPSLTVQELTYLVMQFSHVTFYEKGQENKWRIVEDGYDSDLIYDFVPSYFSDADYLSWLFEYGNLLFADFTQNTSAIVTPENADFIIYSTDGTEFAAFRLYQKGANLRKVLLGLGLQLSPTSCESVSLLPILGYYKAYFDCMYPKRNLNWKMTDCYKFIDSVHEHALGDDLNQQFYYNSSLANARLAFSSFIEELTKMYYFEDADYFTASIDKAALTPSSQLFHTNGTTGISTVSVTSNNSQPELGDEFGISELELARKIYNLVNSESVFGKSVQAALRYRYNADNLLEADAQHVGSHQFMCPVSDILNTADSSYSPLGQFAGTSQGSSESEMFTFKQKQGEESFGYLYAFFCIVPQSGYCQGIDRLFFHRRHEDFYQNELDALGYQAIRKAEYLTTKEIASTDDVNAGGDFTSDSFGLIPRMSEYKTQPHSIVNGNLSRRSQRSSMLPYTLDRWFTTSDVTYTPYREGVIEKVSFSEGYEPSVVDEYMRAIGLSGAFGNYDRIFVNRGSVVDAPLDLDEISNFAIDNFICHAICDITRISAMTPLSNSFTDDSFNKNFNIVHE